MEFSPQQIVAMTAVRQWLDGPKQVFKLFGFAGTGKTTLATHLAEDVGHVLFAAYTGKAAHVLREKGCTDASTIHSLIYRSHEKSKERLLQLEARRDAGDDSPGLAREIASEAKNVRRPAFTLNVESELGSADLLIIDEVSMVSEPMAKDLMSFGTKILVLGDPAQLPPVRGTGYFVQGKPQVLLTEIHRQARDNPILDLATRIRLGEAWHDHPLVHSDVSPEQVVAADQLICGRNRTRHAQNRRVRALLGHAGDLPNVGEKIVCLRNNHELGILNGAIYEVGGCRRGPVDDCLMLQLADGREMLVHRAPFLGQEISPYAERSFESFDYGYSLTCHKAQGSAWDSVIVFDESSCFREDARRWIYTSVTRAAKELRVVA